MEDAGTTLRKIRGLNKSLRNGNISGAMSQIDDMSPSCVLCEEFLTEVREIIQEADRKQCFVANNGKNPECEALMSDALSIVRDLETGYSM